MLHSTFKHQMLSTCRIPGIFLSWGALGLTFHRREAMNRDWGAGRCQHRRGEARINPKKDTMKARSRTRGRSDGWSARSPAS